MEDRYLTINACRYRDMTAKDFVAAIRKTISGQNASQTLSSAVYARRYVSFVTHHRRVIFFMEPRTCVLGKSRVGYRVLFTDWSTFSTESHCRPVIEAIGQDFFFYER
ncbi:hypothetical protein TNCV_4358481 [Trichonephila clavipes]|nr:hypothetical protein TNCV_4358481 [Trichonephila clavipes]